MKIRDIYEWKGIPIVTIILTIISFTISCMVCFVLPERFGEFCLQTKPEHIWQYENAFAFCDRNVCNCNMFSSGYME